MRKQKLKKPPTKSGMSLIKEIIFIKPHLKSKFCYEDTNSKQKEELPSQVFFFSNKLKINILIIV